MLRSLTSVGRELAHQIRQIVVAHLEKADGTPQAQEESRDLLLVKNNIVYDSIL